jgi:hypothetical protein
MAEYVYGNDKCVVSLNEFKTENIEILIINMVNEKKRLFKGLNIRKNNRKNNLKKILESIIDQ